MNIQFQWPIKWVSKEELRKEYPEPMTLEQIVRETADLISGYCSTTRTVAINPSDSEIARDIDKGESNG